MTLHQKRPLAIVLRKQEDGYFGLATDTQSLSPSKIDTQLPLVKPIGEDLKFFYNWKTFGTDKLMFWISMVGTKTEAVSLPKALQAVIWLNGSSMHASCIPHPHPHLAPPLLPVRPSATRLIQVIPRISHPTGKNKQLELVEG